MNKLCSLFGKINNEELYINLMDCSIDEEENVYIKEIVEPSIKIPGITNYKIGFYNFTLTSNNFNYFLQKKYIQKISIISDNIIKIELDRYAIRHCDNRYILVNLFDKSITWCNIPLDEKDSGKRVNLLPKSDFRIL
jgi:hypothetical protein